MGCLRNAEVSAQWASGPLRLEAHLLTTTLLLNNNKKNSRGLGMQVCISAANHSEVIRESCRAAAEAGRRLYLHGSFVSYACSSNHSKFASDNQLGNVLVIQWSYVSNVAAPSADEDEVDEALPRPKRTARPNSRVYGPEWSSYMYA
jgi:hypothetical protein